MGLPPGPRSPAIVNGLRFQREPLVALSEWHAKYGDIFTVRLPAFGPGSYVCDPGEIKKLFTGDQTNLLAGEANSFLEPALGSASMLVLDGPEHLRHRKILGPSFQGSRVTMFRDIVRDLSERHVAAWRPGQEITLRNAMRALTFDVISHAVFGVYEPARVERLRKRLLAVVDVNPLLFAFPRLQNDYGRRSPGGKFQARVRAANGLLQEEIERRRGEPDLDERTDVLSILLRTRDDDGRPMADPDIRDELMTMLAAGHETTATGLASAFDLLLRHPQAFDRLRSEIEAGEDAYLEAAVRESLRIKPVIDAAERTLTEPREICGWTMPAGSKVYPAIYLVHMRPDLFPEPRSFRPERFLDDGTAESRSYSWLPFGGGVRRCIGAALAQAEMAEVLRVVVGSVDLVPTRPEPDPIVLRGITLAPKHGVKVRVVGQRTRVRQALGAETA